MWSSGDSASLVGPRLAGAGGERQFLPAFGRVECIPATGLVEGGRQRCGSGALELMDLNRTGICLSL